MSKGVHISLFLAFNIWNIIYYNVSKCILYNHIFKNFPRVHTPSLPRLAILPKRVQNSPHSLKSRPGTDLNQFQKGLPYEYSGPNIREVVLPGTCTSPPFVTSWSTNKDIWKDFLFLNSRWLIKMNEAIATCPHRPDLLTFSPSQVTHRCPLWSW